MTKISQTEKNIRSADDADSADNKSARSPSPSVLPLLRYLRHLRNLRINILPLKSARLERCPWPFEPSETIPGGMVLPHP